MKIAIIAALVGVLILIKGCGSFAPVPTEKMKVKLTEEWVELLGEDSIFTFRPSDTTRFTLPAIPLHTVAMVPPAGRTPGAYDTVTVNAVVTKRGNVKRAWILSSTNSFFNKAVLKAIVQWKYQPALRNGVPIDTLIKIPLPLVERQ
jgi:TonB family protein